MNEGYLNFDEYIIQGEPHMQERAEAWQIAIGLQSVDGLKTSNYLQETARRNIEGEISIDKVCELVKQYYVSKSSHDNEETENEEADKVSSNISKLLQTDAFTYSVVGLASIHKAIFTGVFKHAGKFREYDITKKEWVLNGDTVLYGRWQDLKTSIEYDLEKERQFDYSVLDKDQMIEHIAQFVSGLWQIHPFCEGNTRTTAIFTIKYLRSQGFKINNELFERHSWYFRNSLVRANYRNISKGVSYEPKFLINFFRNLLLGESNVLKNRYMLIDSPKDFTKKIPEQVPEQVPEQAFNSLKTNNNLIIELIKAIGVEECSISQIMERLNLKHRPNFMEYHLNPAIKEGYIRMLYPDKPRHPRQKYLLTIKGITLYSELIKS